MARPKKPIDWLDVVKLCALQCTQEEIAQFCEVCVDTLNARCLDEQGVSFSEFFIQKRGQGKVSLRRAQWQAAQKGNPTMLIWLGKQHLGQKDKSALEHSGPDGKPIESVSKDALTDEQLDTLIKGLIEKRQGGQGA